jgi:hypothetical protein
MVQLTYTCSGNCDELITTSTYLPNDSDEPPPFRELRNIIYCCNRKKQLIIGAMPIHTTYYMGAPVPIPKEYLVSSNLNILN